MEKLNMEVASGSSTRRQNSVRRFCICGFPVSITQDDGINWQKQAFLDARDGIREKTRVIEKITKTISKMKINFENKETVDDKNEDEIGREFEEFYL
ncbi:unnamed protein product [Eruca vesicaria subsp. sativa]|uniref:Uncharacterized protein n=1 Tax=Eruca vesicaria subsp. sativa TaxID=29727 RepID=A0ABC8K281_ERUVS|nr:unnamed protein product [Eruca vesicaria subsp. sativa]